MDNISDHPDVCVICEIEGGTLCECRDVKTWISLYNAASARRHSGILALSCSKDDFPIATVRYHRECRSSFTHNKELRKFISERTISADKRSSSRESRGSSATSSILHILQKGEVQTWDTHKRNTFKLFWVYSRFEDKK